MKNTFFIITGLSGAGKSHALNVLEDLGYFCVDNLPITLVSEFADMCASSKGKYNKVAIGIDIRTGESLLGYFEKALAEIKKQGIDYKIIYLTADDDNLVRRYSETRRRHPLGKRVIEGIRKERKLMQKIREIADKVIDTSNVVVHEIKDIMSKQLGIEVKGKLVTTVMSFGYKYGIPTDADLIIDVRFMPNPNFIAKLRNKTGKDRVVVKYISKQKVSKEFFRHFNKLMDFLIPNYVREGKNYLTVAIGCTGGRHRSVMITEATARYLKKKKLITHVFHRDIERG